MLVCNGIGETVLHGLEAFSDISLLHVSEVLVKAPVIIQYHGCFFNLILSRRSFSFVSKDA